LRVIATASKHNHEAVRALGAHHVIDYNTEDFVERVKEITDGRGVDAVIDTVSSENATRSLDALAFNGRIAFVAGKPDYNVVKPFTKALSFHEVAWGGAHLSGDVVAQRDLAVMGDELLALVEQKKVDPMLSDVIALEDVPAALQRLSERHVRGKIVAKL
jgi:NADPH:quinone reductase